MTARIAFLDSRGCVLTTYEAMILQLHPNGFEGTRKVALTGICNGTAVFVDVRMPTGEPWSVTPLDSLIKVKRGEVVECGYRMSFSTPMLHQPTAWYS